MSYNPYPTQKTSSSNLGGVFTIDLMSIESVNLFNLAINISRYSSL